MIYKHAFLRAAVPDHPMQTSEAIKSSSVKDHRQLNIYLVRLSLHERTTSASRKGTTQTQRFNAKHPSVLRIHIYHPRLHQVVVDLAAPGPPSCPWGRRAASRPGFLIGRGVGNVLPHLTIG